MKIEIKSRFNSFFSGLKDGDAFSVRNDDSLYLKIQSVECEGEEYLAVSLISGHVIHFSDDMKVCLVDCKIVRDVL